MKQRPTVCLLLLIVALVLLDQLTKWYIVDSFPLPGFPLERFAVWPGNEWLNFDIIRIHNTGVAFGMGNNASWAPFVFLGVQIIALVALSLLFRKGFFNTRLLKIAWALVYAGVIGNMIDRLTRGFFLPGSDSLSFWKNLANGYVVDFLDFSFPWLPTQNFPGGYHWPAFNVADSCICIAAAFFVISAFFFEPEPDPSSSSD